MSELHGEGDLDVNTDSGFNALLAQKVGAEVTEEQQSLLTDTSVAAGLTTEESAQPRDELGRFAPAAEPAAQEEGAAPADAEAQQEESQIDPDLQALIERHGGDVSAALHDAYRQANEAQSLIGRQGNEVGELRQQLAELRGRLEGIQQVTPQQPVQPVPVINADEVEAIGGMLDEHGGYATMNWVANNRPDLIDATFDQWVETDGERGNALRWWAAYQDALRQQGGQAQAEPQKDEFVEQLRTERQMSQTVAETQARVVQNEGQGVWDAIKSHLPAAVDAAGPLIGNAILSPDPNLREQGMNAVVEIAKGRAIAEATKTAKETQQQEIAAKKNVVAQVATGSLRPVDERQPAAKTPEQESADGVAAFKRALLQTETTSVREGLTYGS